MSVYLHRGICRIEISRLPEIALRPPSLTLGPAPQRRPRLNLLAPYAIHENMTPSYDPNFPADLNIKPLAHSASDADTRFDSTAQEGAIRTYGIAGRIW